MGYAQRMGLGKIAPPDSAMEEVVENQRVRELAALITSEAQLQTILDTVSPQSIRGEVERTIRPWCTYPGAHPRPEPETSCADDTPHA